MKILVAMAPTVDPAWRVEKTRVKNSNWLFSIKSNKLHEAQQELDYNENKVPDL